MLLNINGKSLYAEYVNDLENRPTLVFLHDSLGCTELWRDFPEKMAKASQCNLLVYDRSGYGKSEAMSSSSRPVNYLELEADILNELLENLEIDNAILFGHSDGGSIALIAAAKYGDRIKSIICEAAHIFVEDITLIGIYKAMEAYNTTNLPQRLQKYHEDKTDMVFKAWTETWISDDFRTWNIEYLLPGISCPVLFVQGENDEYGSLEQVNKTLDLVSGKAEKFIIPNVYHTPHKEMPEMVLNRVVAFIQLLT
ncbi:alpha/beta fold hydrolase [Flavobacterium sp. ABG]|uniref:alpha/beta fold hydrolase n=1 Tax=Flavobacterium sp. ABG TaxID=1423322 RepID=UPI000649A94A|nr:alpha/beta hydrolase [Flavobacterium sp. ABG]KLT67712.1 alpha/beta hydrolase [Flavobacterium sp. ABG]